MKRPLLPVALYYAGGLLLAEAVQAPLLFLFTFSFALLVAALIFSRARPVLLGLLLVFVGWINLTNRNAITSPNDLRTLVGPEPVIATLRGTLTETPSVRVHERQGHEQARSLVPLQVIACATNGVWQPASGSIIVSTKSELPADIFAGREVEITGVLTPPPRPVAPGLFDYRTYLARQGIYYQLKADSLRDWKRVDADTNRPFADRFLGWAQQTLARGLPEQDEPLRLLWAMTLGWKTALTSEVNEPFMKSGTIIVFAYSKSVQALARLCKQVA